LQNCPGYHYAASYNNCPSTTKLVSHPKIGQGTKETAYFVNGDCEALKSGVIRVTGFYYDFREGSLELVQ
jgi:hypothetical protein